MFEDVHTCELIFVDEPGPKPHDPAEKPAECEAAASIAPVALESAVTREEPTTVLLVDDAGPHLPRLASRLKGALREPLAVPFCAMLLVACVLALGLGVTLGRSPGRGARAASASTAPLARAPRAAILVVAREQRVQTAPSALGKDPQVDVELPATPLPRASARSGAGRPKVAARPRGFGHLGASR
jgi:hypothetical protein